MPRLWFFGVMLLSFLCEPILYPSTAAVFNVQDFGATGKKADDARPLLQKAIDACADAGGGIVTITPGEYTSGTLRLRSKVHLKIEAGATLFASADPRAYDFGRIPSKAALFYGENLEDIAISGEGTVDGQAEYEWRPDDHEHAFDHKTLMQTLGKSLMRSFPKDFPKREVFPHLLWLGNAKNVHISGIKFLHSPSWTMALYACEEVEFENLNIHTSLREGVWADGIDLDGCKDVRIANCHIETGDDCVVFISASSWGPARVCENITVTNCWLSSASAGVKFSEGNVAGVRNIRVTNTILTNVNRGFIFSTTLGGSISNVVLSDLAIDCNRFDWFWSGDGQPFTFRITRLSEFNHEPAQPGEAPPGVIRNVTIRNVSARAKGSSSIRGHAESWLDGISLENVKLRLSADLSAPYDKAEHVLEFRCAKNVSLKNVQVTWGKPDLKQWKSALYFEDVSGLQLEGFSGRGAWPDLETPSLVFNGVSGAIVRHSRAVEPTKLFLKVSGRNSRDISLEGNDFSKAEMPYQLEQDLPNNVIRLEKGPAQ